MIEENNYKLEEIVNKIKLNRIRADKCRAVGINKWGFWIDCDLRRDRANVWYYSNDFDELIRKQNIDINDVSAIQKVFYSEKDNLKHLSWGIVGYY